MRVVVVVEDVRIPCSFCGGQYFKFCPGRSHVAVVCRKGKEESIRALSSRRRGSGWVVEKEAANAVAGRKVEGERNGAQATTTQAGAGLGGRGEHTKRCGERVRGKKEREKGSEGRREREV